MSQWHDNAHTGVRWQGEELGSLRQGSHGSQGLGYTSQGCGGKHNRVGGCRHHSSCTGIVHQLPSQLLHQHLLQHTSPQAGQTTATTHHHRQVRSLLQHITTDRSDHRYNTSPQAGQTTATTHHHRQVRSLLQHITTDKSDSCSNTSPQTGQTAATTHHHRQVRQQLKHTTTGKSDSCYNTHHHRQVTVLLQHKSPQTGQTSSSSTHITTGRSDHSYTHHHWQVRPLLQNWGQLLETAPDSRSKG